MRGENALLWRRVVADCVTPVGIAAGLIEAERGDFLLESVEGGETRGRYSLIGIDPDLVFRAKKERAEINRNWRERREDFVPCDGDGLKSLRALLDECRIDVPEGLPSALACLVGYFGFETIGLVETSIPRAPDNPLDLPDMLFVRPGLILVHDNLTDEVHCIAPVWAGSVSPDQTIERAVARIEAALASLETLSIPNERAHHTPALRLEAVIAPDDYKTMVRRAKDYIEAGDIFQVVLAQRFSTPFPLSSFSLYRALRRVNPSPFLYFLDFPGFSVVGSSPEILVRVRRGEITIRPIAGTRPRGKDENEDCENERSLLADVKERAEHLMLLDLGRNDVGRVARKASVKVTDSFTIERYSHVMHIVSNVVGTLDPKFDALDALLAGFPAGTVSGAPKLRACQIIAELEPETRGPYGGGVGYFAPDGSIDSCIVLRTAIVKDGTMHVQAGAGIVADSDPDYELAECHAKASALVAAANEALRLASQTESGQ